MRKVTKPKEGGKIPNTIHGRIKYAREKSGTTQNELAESLGVTHNYISMIESGKRKPDIYQVCELSKLLGVTCDFLLCQTHVMNSDMADAEISKRLGLSEKAINTFDKFFKFSYADPDNIRKVNLPAPVEISEIIEHDLFSILIHELQRLKGTLDIEGPRAEQEKILVTLLGRGGYWTYIKQSAMSLFEKIITDIAPLSENDGPAYWYEDADSIIKAMKRTVKEYEDDGSN